MRLTLIKGLGMFVCLFRRCFCRFDGGRSSGTVKSVVLCLLVGLVVVLRFEV